MRLQNRAGLVCLGIGLLAPVIRAALAASISSPPEIAILVAVFGKMASDLTLIRWMLSLAPAERREVLRGFADSLAEIGAGNATA